jgi:hypothetical protein
MGQRTDLSHQHDAQCKQWLLKICSQSESLNGKSTITVISVFAA